LLFFKQPYYLSQVLVFDFFFFININGIIINPINKKEINIFQGKFWGFGEEPI
jgi:hypothetical protein